MADCTLKPLNTEAAREDDELVKACAIAAVFAYMQDGKDAGKNISDKYSSAWGRTALLEGTGTYSRSVSRGSLWRTVLGAALLLFFNQAGAQAQENAGAVHIRVGLALGVSKLSFDTFDGAQVFDLATGALVAEVKPEGKFIVSAVRDRGENKIAFTPATVIDRSLIATGSDLNAIKPAAFAPAVARLPLVSNAVKAATNSKEPPALSVPVKVGALPAEFLGGRSSPDLSTMGGVLITPRDYLKGNSQAAFCLNGRAYRGALLISPRTVSGERGASRTVLNAINVVDVEDYLLSVLPSEMPSGWPLEALKAQAIAARSYVMANLGKNSSSGYDVRATVADQAYRGIEQEKESSNLAVAQTRGVVLKHDDKIVPAFFHSSGGGYTEVSEHVWSKPLPYLKSVKDFDNRSPHLSWQRKFSPSDLESRLKADVGPLQALMVIERSPSNRVKSLLVVGERGSTILKGSSVRSLLNLPGTNFNICYEGSSYVLEGQGFGHGLGMSQWGARTLAEHGYNADQILKYYYRDVTFGQIFERTQL